MELLSYSHSHFYVSLLFNACVFRFLSKVYFKVDVSSYQRCGYWLLQFFVQNFFNDITLLNTTKKGKAIKRLHL